CIDGVGCNRSGVRSGRLDRQARMRTVSRRLASLLRGVALCRISARIRRRKVRVSTTARKLVIVESPAKARTIAGYLGSGFDVEASVGHIRDLAQPSQLPAEMKKGPYKKFAIDVDSGFDPYYVVDADKKK